MAYDFDRVRALFADFVEPVPDILSRLESLDAIHVSTIEEVKLDTPVNGRVVLVGDAAHATSPNMAEGVSMALEDALVLGELLAAGDGSPDVLATYSERRAPRIRWVSKRTNRRDRIRELPTVLRNLAIRLSGSVQYERDYRPLFRIP